MRKLVVAEKPSVARDIARVLGVKQRGEGCLEGEEYVVTWAIGHLVSLCEPDEIEERYKKWSMDYLPMLPENIPLKVLPKTRSQFSVVKKLMNSRDTASVICATDSAREGELIFRYINQMAGCKKPVERLWISSMTDQAIRQGFAQLRPDSDYDALYESARCRSEADWLVGMNASRAFSLCYNAHLSVGRVQTPTLSLIVKRDREIAEFVPKDYWELKADFGDYSGLWMDPETKELRSFESTLNKFIDKYDLKWNQAKFDAMLVQQEESAAVTALLTPETAAQVRAVAGFDLLPLVRAEKEFDNDLRELIYIRPAVFPAAKA